MSCAHLTAIARKKPSAPAHGFTLIHKTGSYELYEYIKETP